jgi:outer membrane protein OmpA-like peptidoglycan-associated protein
MSLRGTTGKIPYKSGGGSSYLYTKLSKPLVPGTLYKMNMWLKIKNNTDNMEDRYAFLKHFGMEFSNKPLNADNPPHLLRSYSPFLLESVKSDEWLEINYIIRPTQTLSHLTIGWFEHPLHPVYWHNSDSIHWVYILVDDISVTPILQPTEQDAINSLDYPSERPLKGRTVEIIEEPKKENICDIADSINVYFDVNIDSLNGRSIGLLDSFVLCLKQDTIDYAVEIRGFTDQVGSSEDNQVLSARRAEAVKQYLVRRHKLSESRLITSSHGEEVVTTNSIKNNPVHQRRVEIIISPIRVSDLMYRKLSYYAKNKQADSAYYWIKEWIKRPDSDKILLLFDPELSELKSDKRWKATAFLVRQSYNKYKDAATAFELDSMYFCHQYYNVLPDAFKALKGYVPTSMDITFEELKRLNSQNSEKYIPYIVQRLDKWGWPSPMLVGERAAMMPLFVLTNSQDLSVCKKYLPVAKAACETKKIKSEWYATLFDKIMIAEKGVQFYATQYVP